MSGEREIRRECPGPAGAAGGLREGRGLDTEGRGSGTERGAGKRGGWSGS